MGVSNAGGVGTNLDCRQRIAGCWLMTAAVRTTSATIYRAVYCTDGHASVNHVYYSLQHAGPRRREENIIYLYTAVNLKQNLRSTYCTVEATDKHEALHSLSATTGQLVYIVLMMVVLFCRIHLAVRLWFECSWYWLNIFLDHVAHLW